jgi:IS5 family transposase
MVTGLIRSSSTPIWTPLKTSPSGLSDDQAEFQIQDRLSFMRFLGLDLAERVPDAKTIWLFREQLVQAGAMEDLFSRFDGSLCDGGNEVAEQRSACHSSRVTAISALQTFSGSYRNFSLVGHTTQGSKS